MQVEDGEGQIVALRSVRERERDQRSVWAVLNRRSMELSEVNCGSGLGARMDECCSDNSAKTVGGKNEY